MDWREVGWNREIGQVDIEREELGTWEEQCSLGPF
jgi:hypothetical protein